MKRKYLLLGFGIMAVCVGLAGGATALLPERPGVTKANFDRVKKGMTRAEADTIFGKPASCVEVFCSAGCITWEEWQSEDGARACFAIQNGVLFRDGTWTPSTETIGEKLRRWIRSCLPNSQP